MVSLVLDPGVVLAVPIEDAEALARKYNLRQILIFSFDGKNTGISTWGTDAFDAATAADGANIMKRRWGWPENTIAVSAKVQALYNRIEELEKLLEHKHTERADEDCSH